MTLTFVVRNQTLMYIDTKLIPRIGSAKYLELKFKFVTKDWVGLRKTLHISAGEYSEPFVLQSDTFQVPPYYTQQPAFTITLLGDSDAGVVVPTNEVTMSLDESNMLWTAVPPDPQNSAYLELLKSIVPSDWNQNNPNAKDYIKNRICYDSTEILISGFLASLIPSKTQGYSENLNKSDAQQFFDLCTGTEKVELILGDQLFELTPGGFSDGFYSMLYYTGDEAVTYSIRGTSQMLTFIALGDNLFEEGEHFAFQKTVVHRIPSRYTQVVASLSLDKEGNPQIDPPASQLLEYVQEGYIPVLSYFELLIPLSGWLLGDAPGSIGGLLFSFLAGANHRMDVVIPVSGSITLNSVLLPTQSDLNNYMRNTNPSGFGSLSLNRKANTKWGMNSTTIGDNNEASGENSFAFGENLVSSGKISHTEGSQSKATAFASHAEGSGCTAMGVLSHAEGSNTTARGEASHAEGLFTQAYDDYSHVQGRFNVENISGYAHVVGNGTYGAAPNNQSNAHTLDWKGNAWFAGDVYTGSTSGKNRDAGSKKLATEDYVDSKISDKELILTSSTSGSTKKFRITVDDNGTISATEVSPP